MSAIWSQVAVERRTRICAWVGLYALLVQFLLPLDRPDQWSITPTGTSFGLQTGLQGLDRPDLNRTAPGTPFHDPGMGPICQEDDDSQDFAVVISAFSPFRPDFIQRFSGGGSSLNLSSADLPTSRPRAPPVSS